VCVCARAVGVEHFFPGHVMRLTSRVRLGLGRAPPARASAWRRLAFPPPPPPPPPLPPEAEVGSLPSASQEVKGEGKAKTGAAEQTGMGNAPAPSSATGPPPVQRADPASILKESASAASVAGPPPSEHIAAIRLLMPPPPVRNMGRFVGDLAAKHGLTEMIKARAVDNALVAVYLPWKQDQGVCTARPPPPLRQSRCLLRQRQAPPAAALPQHSHDMPPRLTLTRPHLQTCL